tara:strand:+ start:477 stop:701 length:225 start_codon:yes stop_codon:yes gene_type:complete
MTESTDDGISYPAMAVSSQIAAPTPPRAMDVMADPKQCEVAITALETIRSTAPAMVSHLRPWKRIVSHGRYIVW